MNASGISLFRSPIGVKIMSEFVLESTGERVLHFTFRLFLKCINSFFSQTWSEIKPRRSKPCSFCSRCVCLCFVSGWRPNETSPELLERASHPWPHFPPSDAHQGGLHPAGYGATGECEVHRFGLTWAPPPCRAHQASRQCGSTPFKVLSTGRVCAVTTPLKIDYTYRYELMWSE